MKVEELKPWREVLDSKRKALRRIPDDAMAVLEGTFQPGRLYDDDPAKMAYNVAQYELVEYIKQLRDSDGNE